MPSPPVATRSYQGVMVVDDDDGVRTMLGEWLRKEGFAVWLAATGEEALGVFRRHEETIEAVLMDVRMPGLDGPETLAALRAITPQIKCCFMSGDLGDHTRSELLGLGAAAVFKKPLTLDEVTHALRALVTGPSVSPRAL